MKFRRLDFNRYLSFLPKVHDKKDIKYIEHTCHNTLGDSTMVKNVIKLHTYNSDNSEEWINFVELINNYII